MPATKTPPSQPPQLRGKEPDRLPIHVIAVEKLLIGRISKCHSTLTPLIVDAQPLEKVKIAADRGTKLNKRTFLGADLCDNLPPRLFARRSTGVGLLGHAEIPFFRKAFRTF